MNEAIHYHGHGLPEPIGLEYIAAALESAGFSPWFRWPNELFVGDRTGTARICLFSALTSEYPHVLETAKVAKAKGSVTILGGYHACGCPDRLSPNAFDYIVVGEGEEVAVALAKALIRKERLQIEQLKEKVRSRRILKANRIQDLDALPFPLRSEERLSQYRLFDLMWPPPSQQRNVALVLGSRGCANNCDFCASSTVWGRGVRLRSPHKVIEELSDLKTRFGTNTVVFIDQSLGQVAPWSLKLCEAIKNANLGIHWYHQSNLTVKREVILAMADAGCTKIGFGLEGISPRAVSMIKPVNPCDLEAINSLFEYCNSLGLFVKVYLMIGFPWETNEIVEEYFKWLPQIRANQIKISYFTPFPGTRDWDKHKEQLVTRNWTDFDTVKLPVVYNTRISVAQYHEIRKRLFRAFYGSSTYAEITQNLLQSCPHYVESFREFADYLLHFDMISGNEAWLEQIHYNGNSKVFAVAGR